jgi:hypothetical protein
VDRVEIPVEDDGRVLNDAAARIGALVGREGWVDGGKNPVPTRRAFSLRTVSETVDYSILREWLKRCDESHIRDGVAGCKQPWQEKLSSSRMIDVLARKTVGCPEKCKHVALSYVWGGVHLE